jgi:paraquat-inducible protein B
MNNLVPVEGRPNLYRDVKSGAIINTDSTSYRQHLNHKIEVENSKLKLKQIEDDVNDIKSDISDLKQLILKYLNNQ